MKRYVLPFALLVLTPALQAGTPCASATSDAWRQEVLAAVNRVRQTGVQCGARGFYGPAAALRWAPGLAHAARLHARYIGQVGALTHHNAEGEGLGSRLRLSGYNFNLVAENLANGWGQAGEAIADWAASDGHCANLMHPRLREVGLACFTDNRQWPWWVMTLGAPRHLDHSN